MVHTKKLFFFLTVLTQLYGASFFQMDAEELYQEEVYLSFQYQGVIDQIVIAYFDGDRFYLPLIEMFDLFDLNYEMSATSFSISGFYIQEDRPYVIDLSGLQANFGAKSWQLSASDFIIKEIDFYLAPEIFEEIFGLQFEVDVSRLAIKLTTSEQLPVVARYKRRMKQARLDKYSTTVLDSNFALVNGRTAKLADGIFMDYSWRSTLSESQQSTNLQLGLGGELLFGETQGNMDIQVSDEFQEFSMGNFKWRYVDTKYPWITSISMGGLSSPGLTGLAYDGIFLTNEPLFRQRSFDTYVLDGTTEAEADVELYRDGKLVDVVTSDDVGYYRFFIPLSYGVMEYKIRIYGKQGSTIELDRNIQIPFNFLPTNEMRYGVAYGKNTSDYLNWEQREDVFVSSVYRGLTNWLTAGLGVEYVENSSKDRPVFFSKVSARMINDVLVNLDYAHGNFATLMLKGVGRGSSSYATEYTHYLSEGVYNSLELKHRLSSNIFLPFNLGGRRFTGRAILSWLGKEEDDIVELTTDFNHTLRNLRIRAGYKSKHQISAVNQTSLSEASFGVVYSIPRIQRYKPILRGSYFRTDVVYLPDSRQISDMRFQYIKQLNAYWKLHTFASYNFILESTSMDIGIVMDFEKFRSSANVRSNASNYALTHNIRGSYVYDFNTYEGIWDNRQQVGKSGLNVRMYVDENNSGQFEEGEQVIPGNAVTAVNASSRVVEKSGIHRLTQLQPFRRYNFVVNEAKINNPMLVATQKEFSVVTDPNRLKWMDVPFYTTGIIDGSVAMSRAGGEVSPISGLKIRVVREDGTLYKVVRTFSDGSYYLMEIPPGEYEVMIDDAQLQFLGKLSTPASHIINIRVTEDGDFVEGLDFILE